MDVFDDETIRNNNASSFLHTGPMDELFLDDDIVSEEEDDKRNIERTQIPSSPLYLQARATDQVDPERDRVRF